MEAVKYRSSSASGTAKGVKINGQMSDSGFRETELQDGPSETCSTLVRLKIRPGLESN